MLAIALDYYTSVSHNKVARLLPCGGLSQSSSYKKLGQDKSNSHHKSIPLHQIFQKKMANNNTKNYYYENKHTYNIITTN